MFGYQIKINKNDNNNIYVSHDIALYDIMLIGVSRKMHAILYGTTPHMFSNQMWIDVFSFSPIVTILEWKWGKKHWNLNRIQDKKSEKKAYNKDTHIHILRWRWIQTKKNKKENKTPKDCW